MTNVNFSSLFFKLGSTLIYVNELLYLWIGPHARWPRQIDYQTILEPELKLNPNDSAALCSTGASLEFLIHGCQTPTLCSKARLKPPFRGISCIFLQINGC